MNVKVKTVIHVSSFVGFELQQNSSETSSDCVDVENAQFVMTDRYNAVKDMYPSEVITSEFKGDYCGSVTVNLPPFMLVYQFMVELTS